ncbi:MAG: electron transfer flavoprotein subunit alpha/FixB family protein [Candidatus Zixiibacteriota bacterium]|nr:MAG: electron transfer flavoprotein subunit alpha/FixB family protein [candidate division Zixibacteria bacterium]
MKVMVVALQKQGKLLPVSFELISAARQVSDDISTVILAAEAGPLAEELAAKGAGQVLAVSHQVLAAVNEEIYAKVLSALIDKHQPKLVLGPATFYGKALMARLAALQGGTMASDVTGLTKEGDSVVATRPSYGGNVIAQVAPRNNDGCFVVTVRPKIFPEASEGAGEVVTETVPDDCFTARSTVKEVKVESAGTVSLSDADIIVSAGRGIRGPENVPLIEELAKSLGAAFGASRAIVDAGWVPYSHQVGQTGRTVNPKLYMAVGISGAIQHLVGMQTSKYIVAINKDKDAPIFNVASYGIVRDLFEVVPALTAKFKQELGR